MVWRNKRSVDGKQSLKEAGSREKFQETRVGKVIQDGEM